MPKIQKDLLKLIARLCGSSLNPACLSVLCVMEENGLDDFPEFELLCKYCWSSEHHAEVQNIISRLTKD